MSINTKSFWEGTWQYIWGGRAISGKAILKTAHGVVERGSIEPYRDWGQISFTLYFQSQIQDGRDVHSDVITFGST